MSLKNILFCSASFRLTTWLVTSGICAGCCLPHHKQLLMASWMFYRRDLEISCPSMFTVQDLWTQCSNCSTNQNLFQLLDPEQPLACVHLESHFILLLTGEGGNWTAPFWKTVMYSGCKSCPLKATIELPKRPMQTLENIWPWFRHSGILQV